MSATYWGSFLPLVHAFELFTGSLMHASRSGRFRCKLVAAEAVAELKLDADWVVLSACNTAAGGDKSNAESLSGLARGFIYAGSRALLVSHWYVDSRAAVKITTGAFAEVRRDPSLGRAEALRRSMLATMNDAGRPSHWTPAAHPAIWAPFVLVGEGGAAGP